MGLCSPRHSVLFCRAIERSSTRSATNFGVVFGASQGSKVVRCGLVIAICEVCKAVEVSRIQGTLLIHGPGGNEPRKLYVGISSVMTLRSLYAAVEITQSASKLNMTMMVVRIVALKTRMGLETVEQVGSCLGTKCRPKQ